MSNQDQKNKAKMLKEKLLKKYIDNNNNKVFQKYSNSNAFFVKDDDQFDNKSSDNMSEPQQESSEYFKRKIRIQSDSQNEQNHTDLGKKLIQNTIKLQDQTDGINSILKNKKLIKKLKKAFKIQNDQEIDQFFKSIKIEGMDMKEIKKLIKSQKVNIQLQATQNQKNKKMKKKKKQQKKQKNKKIKDESLKFQGMFNQSQYSDIQIPQQARTIYRNKDGTIKLQTQAELKQKKKQQVFNRLAQWEKGMNAEDSDKDDHQDLVYAKNQIWDDPLKLWNQQNIIKPFQCKYQGPANRFNIKPGSRWDGVIRGNGFQNKLIQQQNLKKTKLAREQKQYLKNL